jgi:hypothetical protein
MKVIIKENKDLSTNNKNLISINNNLEKCLKLYNDQLNSQDRKLKYLFNIRLTESTTNEKMDINSEATENWDENPILQESQNILPNENSQNNLKIE